MDTAGTGQWGLSPVSGGPGILMHPGLRAGHHRPHPCPSPVVTGKPRGGRGAYGQRPPPGGRATPTRPQSLVPDTGALCYLQLVGAQDPFRTAPPSPTQLRSAPGPCGPAGRPAHLVAIWRKSRVKKWLQMLPAL